MGIVMAMYWFSAFHLGSLGLGFWLIYNCVMSKVYFSSISGKVLREIRECSDTAARISTAEHEECTEEVFCLAKSRSESAAELQRATSPSSLQLSRLSSSLQSAGFSAELEPELAILSAIAIQAFLLSSLFCTPMLIVHFRDVT